MKQARSACVTRGFTPKGRTEPRRGDTSRGCAEPDRHRALAEVVRGLNAGSSRWVHVAYPERGDFAWQEGYGAFTVSVRAILQVKPYIARQPEHHRKVSFREEFALFVRQHDIAYDERYL